MVSFALSADEKAGILAAIGGVFGYLVAHEAALPVWAQFGIGAGAAGFAAFMAVDNPPAPPA
jgi:hypothetical protein